MTDTGDQYPRGHLVASLPMYDLPELRQATDALWLAIASGLRGRGVAAPLQLTRGEQPLEATWTSPQLLLSQTCGYPLMTTLRDRAAIIATPAYRAPGCEGPFHRSAVIVRAGSTANTLGDLRGLRCAVNEPTSNTGMNLLRAEVAILADGPALFSEIVHTGSHLGSLEAVGSGQADLAAIDAVTYALLQRLRPALTKTVRLLLWTVRSPGLPLISSQALPVDVHTAIRDVLSDVAGDPALREIRRELMLVDFPALTPAHYRSVLRLAQIAVDRGYPELR